MFLFPTYSKKALSCPKLKSPERRTRLECQSSNAKSLHQTRSQRGRCSPLSYLPKLQEKYRWEKVRIFFLSEGTLGLVFIHEFDYTLDPGSFQTVVCGACEMATLTRLYKLAMCCFPLISKRRISHAKSGFSSKDIMFSVPFLQWKFRVLNQDSQNKRKYVTYLSNVQEKYRGGKRQWLPSRAKMYLVWYLFTELIIYCDQVTLNLLFVQFCVRPI